ncbi:hypothetical protein PQR05_12900, partial [Paraburkholderia sediminicola]|uniref:hypothetical protein n=1 Tax=Paraburkholderia sediminicola TaxID=458836 RepID=UPI0038B6DE6E
CLPRTGANANRPITIQGKAKEARSRKDQNRRQTDKQTDKQSAAPAKKPAKPTPINQTKRNSGFPLPCRAKNNKP